MRETSTRPASTARVSASSSSCLPAGWCWGRSQSLPSGGSMAAGGENAPPRTSPSGGAVRGRPPLAGALYGLRSTRDTSSFNAIAEGRASRTAPVDPKREPRIPVAEVDGDIDGIPSAVDEKRRACMAEVVGTEAIQRGSLKSLLPGAAAPVARPDHPPVLVGKHQARPAQAAQTPSTS